jgi:hypothetical protein
MSNLTETLDDAARILHQRFKAQDDRIEKMEKALSQEMARMREMDDILAGVVKRAGYEGEAPEDLRAGLLKWLDSEIALANNLMGDATTPVQIAQAMLATYRAVKAHIQG